MISNKGRAACAALLFSIVLVDASPLRLGCGAARRVRGALARAGRTASAVRP